MSGAGPSAREGRTSAIDQVGRSYPNGAWLPATPKVSSDGRVGVPCEDRQADQQ